jgi:hypothetical protein
LSIVLAASSCSHSDEAKSPAAKISIAQPNAKPTTCPPAPAGIVVAFDKVAYFPSRARTSELARLCPAIGDTDYDAVGWQAPGHKFPFVGATLVAIHSGAQPDTVPADEPDMWTASGDSIRLADGQLLPKTLGALRGLGTTFVDDNDVGSDDWNGPGARNCRYPEILFNLDGEHQPKKLNDSARVLSIDINVRRRDMPSTLCKSTAR